MNLTYVGGHDAVDVRVPDWAPEPTVANGESYDFPDAVAELLLEQPTNWQRTEPELSLEERLAKAKTHDELDAIAAELDVSFDAGLKAADKKAALAAALATNDDTNDDDAGDDSGEEH